MAQQDPKIPYWKNGLMQVASGGSAGFIEICTMHPLDVVKTRFQFQSDKTSMKYTTIADCFRKTIQNEGFLAVYKGILPPIIVETPKRATKFFTFEQYKTLFSFGSSQPSAYSLMIAGLFSGLTEAFVVNPFEVVKVRLQTDTQKFIVQRSSFDTAKKIYAEGGFGSNGLNRGLTSTLLRHGIFNMVFFGFYFNIKPFIPKTDSKVVDYGYRISAGFVAGGLASVINIPFDVAKSRIQGYLPESSPRVYNTCFQTIALVHKEEGLKALYKGLTPKLVRYGPGGAIMMIGYEEIYKILKAKWT